MNRSERDAVIVDLHVRQGMMLSEIGRRFGLTRERVRQIVKENGGRSMTRSRWAKQRKTRLRAAKDAVAAKAAYRNSLDWIRDRCEVDANGCWIWQRAMYPSGYGHVAPNRAGGYAHRLAWELAYGPIPTDGPRLCVCHKCDVPACVNPDHLFLGTYSENIQDSIAKGRFTRNRGPRARKTHCHRGHPFDEENTYVSPTGSRRCRACGREAVRRYKARLRLGRAQAAA